MILNNISNIKYHFVVRFSIGYVYNKSNAKQILLNSLNFISLSSLFHFKTEAVFDRHQATNLSNKNVSVLINGTACILVYIISFEKWYIIKL